MVANGYRIIEGYDNDVYQESPMRWPSATSEPFANSRNQSLRFESKISERMPYAVKRANSCQWVRAAIPSISFTVVWQHGQILVLSIQKTDICSEDLPGQK